MIVSRSNWRRDGSTVVVELECHDVYVFASWVMTNGRISGRITCTHNGCRKTFDRIVLEGWES